MMRRMVPSRPRWPRKEKLSVIYVSLSGKASTPTWTWVGASTTFIDIRVDYKSHGYASACEEDRRSMA